MVLGCLLVAAFVFRLILAWGFRTCVSFDEAHYVRMAGGFFAQGFQSILHPYWPPLYPGCIALLGSIFGDLEWSARLINILAGTGLVFFIYRS